MCISLRDSDVLVAGKLLGQLEVAARAAQHGGDEVMPEGVGGDFVGAFRFGDGFSGALVHDLPAGGGRDGFDLLTSAAIMPGKERQAGEGASGSAIQLTSCV